MPRNVRIIVVLAVFAQALVFAPATAAYTPANDHFLNTWSRTDEPVASGAVSRTWMWGPQPFTDGVDEPYVESPAASREVQYYDKARMEITYPDAVDDGVWYVTNGLLVVELVTGALQLGDGSFVQLEPAQANVAGDADDPTGPTYATFNSLQDAAPGAVGDPVVARVDRAANVVADPSLAAQDVSIAYVDDVTQHGIAGPFWSFMNSSGLVEVGGANVTAPLFQNPFYATGRPISEPYWATVKVANSYTDVLLQCFERRCLTFTPRNAAGWQVEAGNVGQHYYQWTQSYRATLATGAFSGGEGGALNLNDSVWVTAGAGSLSGDAVIAIQSASNVPANPPNVALSGAYDLSLFGGSITGLVTLQFAYDPASIPTGVAENQVFVAFYDGGTGSWQPMPTTIDAATHVATVQTDHLSSWQVFSPAAGDNPDVNDPPFVDLNGPDAGGTGSTVAFSGSPVDVAPDGALSDPDDANLASASATLLSAPDGASESLSVDVGATGIVASWDAATGVLSLSGDASLEAYAQVLGTLAYDDTALPPTPGDREVHVVVSDGEAESNTAVAIVAIAASSGGPDASDQTVTVAEDGSAAIDLSSSVVGGNGALSYAVSVLPTHGALTGAGSALAYSPDANFNGPDAFTFTVTDADGNSDSAVVSITVTPVNDNPDAVDDVFDVAEDSVDTGLSVLANDTDAPDSGEVLTITAVTQPSQGSVAIAPDSLSVLFTAAPNTTGTVTFTYTISDGNGGADTATVTVNIGGENDRPTANDQSVTTPEDTPVDIVLTGSDPDGDPLSFHIFAGALHGTVTIDGNVATYSPDPNYNGPDRFLFQTSDGELESLTATVSIDVLPVNDAPAAIDQAVSTNEDTPVTFALDVADVDGDALTCSQTVAPAQGSVSFASTPGGCSATYTPNANVNGTDSFSYSVGDGALASGATVSITIVPVNDAPVANDDVYAVNEDGALTVNTAQGVRANDTDVDGDALTVSLVTDVSHGSLTLHADGSFSYTPDANYSGPDSFTYSVSDGNGGSDTATAGISVSGVNDPPTAADQLVVLNEDSSVQITLIGSDIDGDPLTFVIDSGPSNGAISNPTADGKTFTYTPNANYFGADSITFHASDGQASSGAQTVSITVNEVNDDPDAADDGPFTVAEDSGATSLDVLSNDTSAPDTGETLAITGASDPPHGVVVIAGDNLSLSYQPDANYFGSDSFTYTVGDGRGGSDTATVSIDVTGVNDPPTAADQSVTVGEDSGANTFALNLADIDGDPLTCAVVSGSEPTKGTVSFIGGAGTCSAVYTPNADQNGLDSFSYTVTDPSSASTSAQVAVNIDAINDAPSDITLSANTVAENDAGAIIGNVTVTDVDDASHTVTVSDNRFEVVAGQLKLKSGQSLDHEAEPTVSLDLTATDPSNLAFTKSFVITVTDVNEQPTDIQLSNQSVDENAVAAVIGNVTTVDPDAGDSHTYTVDDVRFEIVAGQLKLKAGESLDHETEPTVALQITTTDLGLLSFTKAFTIQVNDANELPTATDQGQGVTEDTPATFNLDVTDVEDSFAQLSCAVVSGSEPTKGTVSFNGGGCEVTYTPSPDQTGADSFTYEVTDTGGLTDQATVSISISAVNDAPVLTAGGTLNYAENDPPSTIDTGLTVADVDSTDLQGATVQITGNYQNGEDVLSFVDTATITGNWDNTTGTLTLSGTDTLVNYAAALQSVRYANTSDNPSTAQRTVTWIGTDSSGAGSVGVTSVINVAAINDPPLLTVTDGPITWVSGNLLLDGGATVADVDSADFDTGTLTVTITAGGDADDRLIIGNGPVTTSGSDVLHSGIDVGDFSGGDSGSNPLVITFDADATRAIVESVVRAINYSSVGAPTGTRTITLVVTDGDGGTSNIETLTIQFNQPPLLTAGGTLNYTEDNPVENPALAIDTTITADDPDGATIDSATVQITGNYVNGQDVLAFVNAGGITAGPFDAGTGTLTLTGVGVAEGTWQTALRSVTYQNTSDNPSTAARTVTWIASDGISSSTPVTSTINVTATNDAPVVTAGGTLSYTENDAPAAIDTTITTSDVDSVNLQSATVQITSGYQNDAGGSDVLSFANTASITAAPFDATTGTLTLTGSDTLANWQAALRAVTYHNTGENPGATARTVTWIVNDGSLPSAAATSTINVAPQNDNPVAVDDPAAGQEASFTTDEDSNKVLTSSMLANDTDPENDTLSVQSVTQPATGDGSVTLVAGVVTFVPGSDFNDLTPGQTGTATFTYTVSDGNGGSDSATVVVTVTGANDKPTFTASDPAAVFEDSGAASVPNWATFDAGGGELGQAVSQYTVSNVTNPGLFSAGPTVANVGTLSYTPAPNAFGTSQFDVTVTDDGGTPGVDTSDLQTFTITVTGINDAPSFTASDPVASDEDGGLQTVNGWATFNPGPNEGTQIATYTVSNVVTSANLAFTSGPAVSSNGNLTYTAAADSFGTATFDVYVTDDGGVANGGVNQSGIQSFTITVNAVNDPPSVATTRSFDARASLTLTVSGATQGGGLLVGASDKANELPTTLTVNGTAGVGTLPPTTVDTIGGTLAINQSTGDFTYAPAMGVTGSGTFQYKVCDTGTPPPGACSATVTVTVTVSGPIVYFVDGAAGGPGDGSFSNPYSNLTELDGRPNPTPSGETVIIFVYEGSYSGTITLKDNELLLGQGAFANGTTFLDGINSYLNPDITAPPAGSQSYPAGFTGVRPTVTGSIVLATGNVVDGIDVSASAGSAITATNEGGTTTLDQITVTTSGTANGLNLTGQGGTLTATLVAVNANSSGAALVLDGGNGTVNLNNADFTQTGSGRVVSIVNRTTAPANTITFDGSSAVLASSGTGVFLNNNSQATVKFQGGVNLTTGANAAFAATAGGTVEVTGSSNTISTTTASALTITDVTIGANGVTLLSIAKNGGSTTAIALKNTGSGTFTVTGSGTTTGSGGTIQNIVGVDAITIENTNGLVTLKNMNIQDIAASDDATAIPDTQSGIDAIHGKNVNAGLTLDHTTIARISDSGINGSGATITTATNWNGLTITSCTIEDTNRFAVTDRGDATNEGAVHIYGLKGTVSITDTTIQRVGTGLRVYTATSGSLDLTVQSSSFLEVNKELPTQPLKRVGLFGITITQLGTLNSVIRIGDPLESNVALGNTFTNNALASIRLIAETASSGNMTSVVSENTFTVNDHSSPGTSPGSMAFNFPQGGVLFRTLSSGSFKGIFSHNTFNEAMHADGGLGNLSLIAEAGSSQFYVHHNTFNKPWDAPVELRADGNVSSAVLFEDNTWIDGTVGSSSDDLGAPFPAPYAGFYVQVRDGGNLDLTMRREVLPLNDTGNGTWNPNSLYVLTGPSGGTLNLSLSNDKAPNGYRFTQQAGTLFQLYTGSSASTDVTQILHDNGNTGGSGSDNTDPPVVTTSGTITLTAVAPTLPSTTFP